MTPIPPIHLAIHNRPKKVSPPPAPRDWTKIAAYRAPRAHFKKEN